MTIENGWLWPLPCWVQSLAQHWVHCSFFLLGCDMGTNKDGYRLKRAAYMAEARMHHELLCNFFDKPVESVVEVQERLNAQLRAHEINQMAREIEEINEEVSDG